MAGMGPSRFLLRNMGQALLDEHYDSGDVDSIKGSQAQRCSQFRSLLQKSRHPLLQRSETAGVQLRW